MKEKAAPDDLQVLLHTSLVRLLANPSVRPKLTADCLETTFDLLHLDIKCGGWRIGTIVLGDDAPPRNWHDLYPADFDRRLGDLVDAESDRQAVVEWWRTWRARGAAPPLARPLKPRLADALAVLSRRYADLWIYVPQPQTVLCGHTPREAALFVTLTRDYNLVQAACVWLGRSTEPQVCDCLIALAGNPSPVTAHNAQLALSYSPDPRIRELLLRYNVQDQTRSPAPARRRAASDRDNPLLTVQTTEFPA